MELGNTNQESLNIIDITIQRDKSLKNKTVKLSLKNSNLLILEILDAFL